MKVSGAWLSAAKTQAVFAALTQDGHTALAVGGCIRNALMGVPVTDVDLSTDALPETVIELAERAGLKAVPTGIDHGTVTLVSDGTGYEVTTFRADTETDGRHAVVRFSKDMTEDAVRRDFTMNALYAQADGTVIDPLDGLADLTARRVRFIGDASDRIREDYLRILRFFRFAAWYGDPALGMDADALAAISAALDGLQTLSKERVTAETVKLLSSPDPAPAVASMEQTGVLAALLPGGSSQGLAPLVHHEQEHAIQPDAMRRLAVLGPADTESLRLSKKLARQFEAYQSLISADLCAKELGYRNGATTAVDVLLLRAAMSGMLLPKSEIDAAREGAAATFPVKPGDLMPRYSGAALGDQLRALEARWIASDFKLGKDDLLT